MAKGLAKKKSGVCRSMESRDGTRIRIRMNCSSEETFVGSSLEKKLRTIEVQRGHYNGTFLVHSVAILRHCHRNARMSPEALFSQKKLGVRHQGIVSSQRRQQVDAGLKIRSSQEGVGSSPSFVSIQDKYLRRSLQNAFHRTKSLFTESLKYRRAPLIVPFLGDDAAC